jgi:hypothetical protein
MRVQNLARSSAGVAAQPSKAPRAACTARSTSSAVPSGIRAITSPFDESNTSIDPEPDDGTHAPST